MECSVWTFQNLNLKVVWTDGIQMNITTVTASADLPPSNESVQLKLHEIYSQGDSLPKFIRTTPRNQLQLR